MDLFECQDYRKYIEWQLKSGTLPGRGSRTRLAEGAGCQIAYVSQVLRGDYDFSLEQGERINRFFGHSPEESHFFMLLLLRARAGSEDLRRYFDAQIHEALEKRLVLKHRLKVSNDLSPENQTIYYSRWYYAAIHICLTIPGMGTKPAIAKRLRLPIKIVNQALGFLVSAGLATTKGEEYQPGNVRIHLGNNSPNVIKHHTNWRMRAVEALDREEDRSLHYSSVVSLSTADLLKIKARLIAEIEKTKAIIRDSPGEELCGFSLDLFPL